MPSERRSGCRRSGCRRSGCHCGVGCGVRYLLAAGVDGEHQVEPADGQVEQRGLGELGPQHRCRHRPIPEPVACSADVEGRAEPHRHHRQPGSAAERKSGFAAVGIESQGVDDRGQSASQPGRDDGVQHRERIDRGIEIALAAADGCPQGIRRDDLVAGEMLPCPGGLARTGRADQQHQRRSRNLRHHHTLTRQLGVLTEFGVVAQPSSA